MKSLKLKILLPILLTAIVGLSAMGLIGFSQAKAIIEDDVRTIAKTKADMLASMANEQLHRWSDTIKFTTATDSGQTLNVNGIKALISENPSIFEDFSFLMVADLDGNYEGTHDKSGNIADRAYFKEAVARGYTVISEPVISKSMGVPIIVIAAPIESVSENRIVGIIVGIVELSHMTNLINEESFGERGYAYMINKEGIVIAHPNEEYILNEDHNFFNKPGLETITKNMTLGAEDVETYVLDGDSKIAAYMPIEATGWSIAMTAYEDEVLQALTGLGLAMMLVTLVIIVILTTIIIVLISALLNLLYKSHR